jgi:hypothetical protein
MTVMTPGQLLRSQLDEALKRTGAEVGRPLLWDERELAHLDAAVAAADTAELLRVQLESTGADPKMVIRLAAERRIQLKAVTDHVGALSIWANVPKSERHQRAGTARWDQWRYQRGTTA